MTCKRILSVASGVLIGLITAYVLQSACFRLVEDYANTRLKWAWGNYIQGSINPMLAKLPLDHFANPPSHPKNALSILDNLKEENDYSKKVFSFALPLRDRFFEFVNSKDEALGNYEIRDLQMIRGVVAPGLTRAALSEDVVNGLARREGDLIDYANAFFLVVTKTLRNSDYEKQFAKLEETFGFLLENGMACAMLAVDSLEDLIGKIAFLKASHPQLAKNLIVYGEDDSASLIMEACYARPASYKGVIAVNPSRPVPAVTGDSRVWFLGILNKDSVAENINCAMVLDWARAGRNSEYLYPSRLGGLIRTNVLMEDLPISSLVIAYAVKCIEYFKVADILYAPPAVSSQERESLSYEESLASSNEDTLKKEEDATPPDPVPSSEDQEKEPNFDCKLVREYRKIHGNNPEMVAMSNRELVLRIGSSFESMGAEVMEQVGIKDPIFMRFYLSLKALSKGPTD